MAQATRGTIVETKRRSLLTEPGESLLVSPSPFESAMRFEQFSRSTGVPIESLSTSLLCTVPIPAYPARFERGRRWPGVRPEAMWHPLLWLPPRLSSRYRVSVDPVVLESDDLWSVRVALEMMASGLYDQASGAWVDILDLVGVDIDTDTGCDRVAYWLDGAPDSELDSLDGQVEAMLDLSEPDQDWAAVTAAESMDALRISSWAFAADDLAEVCARSRSLDQSGDRGPDDFVSALKTVADMATVAFATPPTTRPDDVGEHAFWTDASDSAAGLRVDDERAVDSLAERMQARLDDLRATYWPIAEEQLDRS